MIRRKRLSVFALALSQIGLARASEAPAFLDRVVGTLARMSHVCLPLENPGESHRIAPAVLETDFKKLRSAKRYCDAAHWGYRLSLDLEESDPTRSLYWGEQTVAVLLQAKAYDYVYEYGSRVLNDLNIPYTDSVAEPLRFLILQGMHSVAVELGSNYDPKWMQWALGMSAGPNGEDTRPMQFLAFAADYPNSKSFDAVKAMAQNVTDIYLARVLTIAKSYEHSRPYSPLATFISVNAASIYKNELMEASPVFPEVNSKAIEYQAQLVKLLRSNALPPNLPLGSVSVTFALPSGRTYGASDLAVAVIERIRAQFQYMRRQAAAAAIEARKDHAITPTQLLAAQWKIAISTSQQILSKYKIPI